MSSRFLSFSALVVAGFLLAACDDPEEVAEEYYQSGLALLEAGDVERALLEFRNVFEYNGFHREAREIYAATVLEQGNVREAYGQYLRLIEQYPDLPDIRIKLAEIALDRSDWGEVARHGEAARTLAPDLPGTRAIDAALAYRTASLENDPAAETAAVDAARAVLEDAPDNMAARRIVIAALAKSDTPADALPEIERALDLQPTSLEFLGLKFTVLLESGQEDAAGTQLEQMFALYPEDEQIQQTLINWYMRAEDFAATEALLRRLAATQGGVAGQLTVVAFIDQTKGAEAAIGELDALLGDTDLTPDDSALLSATKATLMFEAGARDDAIALLDTTLEGLEPSDERRRVMVLLARMREATGDQPGAAALVAEVLAQDTSNVDALKLRATWAIRADQPDAAINDLRSALDQSPRDAQIFTLLAQAHARAGSPELAGERLSLAVDVSGAAPDESIRYAQFLLRAGRSQAAETILSASMRAHPGAVPVMSLLANLRLGQQNWAGARDILNQLEQVDTDEGRQLALRLRTAMLMGQNRVEDSLNLLESLTDDAQTEGDINATIQLVLLQIEATRIAQARVTLDRARARHPDNKNLRLLDGTLTMIAGDPAGAEAILRALVAEAPGAIAPTRRLYGVLMTDGRPAEAEAAIDAALAVNPTADPLLMIKAGKLEQRGEIAQAIEIYEGAYARDSDNIIMANNLASLLVTQSEDAETVARAFTIARRLSGLEVPAFQDTYGWLLTLTGDPEAALPALRAAVAGLPEDALTRYHLGMTYAALERREAAIETLQQALRLAQGSPLAQFDTARATLRTLEAQSD